MIGEMVKLWRLRSWLKSGGIDKLDFNALRSRKFLILLAFIVAIGATLIFAPEELATLTTRALILVAVTYFGVQGADDIAARVKGMDRQGDFGSKKFKVALGVSVLISVLAQIGVPPYAIELISKAAVAYLGVQGAVDFTGMLKSRSRLEGRAGEI